MSNPDRQHINMLFRVANRIHRAALKSRPSVKPKLNPGIIGHIKAALSNYEQARFLAGRGKYKEAVLKANDSAYFLENQILGLRNALEHASSLGRLSNLSDDYMQAVSDIVRDLVALERDFDTEILPSTKYKSDNSVVFTTDEIEFEDIELGAFKITLKCDYPISYNVEAINPNPAANDSSVTHPHLMGRTLCEGESALPIRAAIKQARIYDFFTIVDGLLNTYTEGEAYAEIDGWNGEQCSGCGESMSGARFTCECCESDGQFCRSCMNTCNNCANNFICTECMNTCSCGESICDNCKQECSDCGSTICNSCKLGCSNCGEFYCGECMSDCYDCGNNTCRGCIAACADCDDEFCGSCLNEEGRCNVGEAKYQTDQQRQREEKEKLEAAAESASEEEPTSAESEPVHVG